MVRSVAAGAGVVGLGVVGTFAIATVTDLSIHGLFGTSSDAGDDRVTPQSRRLTAVIGWGVTAAGWALAVLALAVRRRRPSGVLVDRGAA